MKTQAFRTCWRLLLIYALACLTGRAQNIDLGNQGKNVDFTKMPVTKPVKTGTNVPGGCNVGEFFLKSDDSGGAGLYLCAETNVWSRVNVGSTTGSMIAGTGIVITGSQVSVEDAIVPLYFTGDQAPTIACNAGRDRYLDTVTGRVYLCTATNAWKELARTDQANQWAADQKQTFAPGVVSAGINVGSVAQSPSAPADGDIWYDTTAAKFRCRQDGVTVDCVPSRSDTALAVWDDDFTGALISLNQASSSLPWGLREIGAGCGTMTTGSEAQHPGTIQVPAGGELGMGCQLVHGVSNGWAQLADATDWEYRWVFRGSAVTGAKYRAGFMDPAEAAPLGDGIWVELDASTAAPTLAYRVRAGGVSATHPGPAAGDPGTTWYTLRLRSRTAGEWQMSISQQGGAWSPEVTVCSSSCMLISPLPATALSPFFEVQQTETTIPSAAVVADAWKGRMRVER